MFPPVDGGYAVMFHPLMVVCSYVPPVDGGYAVMFHQLMVGMRLCSTR